MKKVILILLTITLILLMHKFLLYKENLSMFDIKNIKVIKSLLISSFSILLIGGIIIYQNRKK
jgi:hypothetical protein